MLDMYITLNIDSNNNIIIIVYNIIKYITLYNIFLLFI